MPDNLQQQSEESISPIKHSCFMSFSFFPRISFYTAAPSRFAWIFLLSCEHGKGLPSASQWADEKLQQCSHTVRACVVTVGGMAGRQNWLFKEMDMSQQQQVNSFSFGFLCSGEWR